MPFIFPTAIFNEDNLKQIKILAESRIRFESRTNRDFDSAFDDDSTLIDQRVRIGFELERESMKLVARWEYAGQQFDVAGTNTNDDIVIPYEFYIDAPIQEARVRFGRQELKVASGRYVQSSGWSNQGNTFDAFRITSTQTLDGKPRLDAFFAQIGQAASYSEDARLVGLGTVSGLGQTYVFYKHDNPTGGELNLFTVDHIWGKTISDKINLMVEGAFQFGDAGSQRKEAWAFHSKVNYKASDKTGFFVEVNAASGGDTVTEDRTFDPLYPSSHSRWGILDLQTNSNFNHIQIGVEHDFEENLSSHLSWNKFELRDARDGWYRGANSINTYSGGSFIDPTGMSGRDVGSEIDLYFTYAQGDNVFGLGGGIFLPGSFIESFVPNPENQFYMYGFWSWKF